MSELKYELNPNVKVYKMEDNVLPPGVDWDPLGAFIKRKDNYDQYLYSNDRVIVIDGEQPFPIRKQIFEKLFITK